jgi:hypothetical protein
MRVKTQDDPSCIRIENSRGFALAAQKIKQNIRVHQDCIRNIISCPTRPVLPHHQSAAVPLIDKAIHGLANALALFLTGAFGCRGQFIPLAFCEVYLDSYHQDMTICSKSAHSGLAFFKIGFQVPIIMFMGTHHDPLEVFGDEPISEHVLGGPDLELMDENTA